MIAISFKKLYTIVAYVLCLMGCMYQTYKISELYFGYQTTTNVRYGMITTDDQTTHIAVTFCTLKIYQIEPNIILKLFKIAKDGYILREFNKMSISDQFNSFAPLRSHYSCQVQSADGGGSDADLFTGNKYMHSLSDVYHCI